MKDLTPEEVAVLNIDNWLCGELEDLTENFGVMRTSLMSCLLIEPVDADHVLDVVTKLEQLSKAWDAVYKIEKIFTAS